MIAVRFSLYIANGSTIRMNFKMLFLRTDRLWRKTLQFYDVRRSTFRRAVVMIPAQETTDGYLTMRPVAYLQHTRAVNGAI